MTPIVLLRLTVHSKAFPGLDNGIPQVHGGRLLCMGMQRDFNSRGKDILQIVT